MAYLPLDRNCNTPSMKDARYLPVLGRLLEAPSAGAATLDYDLVPLGSDSYRYEYTGYQRRVPRGRSLR